MGSHPRRPTNRPVRKELDKRTPVDRGTYTTITLTSRLRSEPFPVDPEIELTVELVTEEGYQWLELHPTDPADLEGEPAHERAVSDR